MKKYLIILLILAFGYPAFAAEFDVVKLDAAKRASCSNNTPCSINTKSHNGTIVVKVNSAVITKDGVIKVDLYNFKRYVYNSAGEFLHEITNK